MVIINGIANNQCYRVRQNQRRILVIHGVRGENKTDTHDMHFGYVLMFDCIIIIHTVSSSSSSSKGVQE